MYFYSWTMLKSFTEWDCGRRKGIRRPPPQIRRKDGWRIRSWRQLNQLPSPLERLWFWVGLLLRQQLIWLCCVLMIPFRQICKKCGAKFTAGGCCYRCGKWPISSKVLIAIAIIFFLNAIFLIITHSNTWTPSCFSLHCFLRQQLLKFKSII